MPQFSPVQTRILERLIIDMGKASNNIAQCLVTHDKKWVQDSITDVLACMDLVIAGLELDPKYITKAVQVKRELIHRSKI